jgi:hypothetical protein
MHQTLLALAALLAFSLYALSRHQEKADVDRSAVSSEMQHAAAELARNLMIRADRYAFDESAIGQTGMQRTPPTTGIGPDADETHRGLFDDIDDFNGQTWLETIPRGADSLRFNVTISVGFAQDAQPDLPSAVPTFSKAVQIRVEEPLAPGSGRAPAVATLRKVFTAAGQSLYL